MCKNPQEIKAWKNIYSHTQNVTAPIFARAYVTEEVKDCLVLIPVG